MAHNQKASHKSDIAESPTPFPGIRIGEWLASLELKKCLCCGGTGKCLDDARVGQSLRQIRKTRQISGREMARRLKLSAAYLSDLELGRRGWNEIKVTAYLNAVQEGATT